ncbi:MAG: HAD family hydrolase [Bacteroidota bacterium]
MPESKKLVVFDVDGTLTDSLKVYHKVVIDSLKLMGIAEVDTDFFNYKYHTDSYTLKFNYENFFNREYTSDLLGEFEHTLITELEKHPPTREIKGAKECVERLLDNNFAVAFATGSLPKPAELKLNQCDIWYEKDLIATSKISFAREPFVKQSIEMAKRYFKVDSFDKVYSVGDGIWDMQTAQRLDLDFIGIGQRNKDILIEMGCKTHFDDLTGLADLLKNI